MSTKNETVNKKRKAFDEDTTQKKSYADLEAELVQTKKILADTQEKLDQALATSATASNNTDDEVSDGEDSVQLDNPKDSWMTFYVQLREYRIMHGTCHVPASTNKKLNKWIMNQKCCYVNVKQGKTGITPKRIFLLEGLGIHWGKKFPPPRSWDDNFEDLVKYQKATGTCNVTMHKNNPTPLAKWVSAQRSEYKRFRMGQMSLLTVEQMEQLKSIGFKWSGPRLSKLQ